mgnify:CR=1 FL=1
MEDSTSWLKTPEKMNEVPTGGKELVQLRIEGLVLSLTQLLPVLEHQYQNGIRADYVRRGQ